MKINFQGGITEHKAPFAHEHAEINELEDIVKELKYDFHEDDDEDDDDEHDDVDGDDYSGGDEWCALPKENIMKKSEYQLFKYESRNFKSKVNKYMFP